MCILYTMWVLIGTLCTKLSNDCPCLIGPVQMLRFLYITAYGIFGRDGVRVRVRHKQYTEMRKLLKNQSGSCLYKVFYDVAPDPF
jgi:hypothetical protein